jgi:hypothetical protein
MNSNAAARQENENNDDASNHIGGDSVLFLGYDLEREHLLVHSRDFTYVLNVSHIVACTDQNVYSKRKCLHEEKNFDKTKFSRAMPSAGWFHPSMVYRRARKTKQRISDGV